MTFQVSSVTPDCRQIISKKLKSSNLTYISRAKILTAFPDPRSWTEICEGYLTLYVNSSGFIYLSVFDKDNFDVCFSHELYQHFSKKFKKLDSHLYCFPSERCNIGVLFLIENEGIEMEKQIRKVAPKKDFFKRLFSKKQTQNLVVSLPECTEKCSGVQWDAEGGYKVNGSIQNLPIEHQQFISQMENNRNVD